MGSNEFDAMTLEEMIHFLTENGIRYGLSGLVPTIERMLADGRSFSEIAKAINWEEKTLRQHYQWHLEKQEQKIVGDLETEE